MAAPNFVPPLDLAELVRTVLQDVRAGRFGLELRKNAELAYNRREVFQDIDEVNFGRAHSLWWEVLDQAGDYDHSLDVIQDLASNYLERLEKAEHDYFRVADSDDEITKKRRPVAKQMVMCCLAYACALYRKPSPDRPSARQVLDICETFLQNELIDTRPSSKFPCWGPLARLNFFYGLELLKEGSYSDARRRFTDALGNMWNRIDDKKPKSLKDRSNEVGREVSDEAEDGEKSGKFLVEQLFANHCVGKVLSFGLGWSAMLLGELSKALELFQSARVMLADSEDTFLKWQVELFYCTAQRAKGADSLDWGALLDRMEECCSALKGHREYYLQSLGQRAVTEIEVSRVYRTAVAAHLDKGEALLREAKSLRQCSQKLEYSIWADVLQSRFERERGGTGFAKSRKTAQAAYERAIQADLAPSGLGRAQIELAKALSREVAYKKDTRVESKLQQFKGDSDHAREEQVAKARVLTESEIDDLNKAIKLLDEALAGSREDRVRQCDCHLQLTEIYLMLDDLPSTVARFAKWEQDKVGIEHRRIIQKSESLRHQLQQRRLFVISDKDTRQYHRLARDFVRFLLDREMLRQQNENPNRRKSDKPQAANQTRLDKRTESRWEKLDRSKAAKQIGVKTVTINGWIEILQRGGEPILKLSPRSPRSQQ